MRFLDFFYKFLKIVDLEQKSEKILALLIKMILNITQLDEKIEIKTPSFMLLLVKTNSTSLPAEINISNNKFILPSICQIKNCSKQIVSYLVLKYSYN